MALKKSKTVKKKPSKSRLGKKKSKTVKKKPLKSRLGKKKSKSVKRKPSKSILGKKNTSLKKRLLKQRAGENTSEDEYQDLLPRDSTDWTSDGLINPPLCLVKNKEGEQIDPQDGQETNKKTKKYRRDYKIVKKLSNFKKFMLLQDMDEEKLKTFLDFKSDVGVKANPNNKTVSKGKNFQNSWEKCKENKDKCKEAFRELKKHFDEYFPNIKTNKYEELHKFYREKYGLCKDKSGEGQYEYNRGCVLPCIDEDYKTKGKLSTWEFFEKKKK